VLTIDVLLGALDLESTGPGAYRAGNTASGHGTIFGGQLLAQTVVAARRGHEAKAVKTVQAVFARAGRLDAPVEITVEPIHDGRAFASTTVTLRQGDRVCARSLVLLTADEPDFVRHADPAPAAVSDPPAGEGRVPHGDGGDWRIEVVGDVDVSDPDLVGPPELDVWTTRRCWPTPPTASSSAPPCGPTPGSGRPRPT
jgi:acyl-CoA thioesterase II